MPWALAAPTVVTRVVAKLVTAAVEVAAARAGVAGPLAVEAVAVVAALLELLLLTAEADAAGRPLAACALETGPLSVAMMSGA